MNFTSQELRQGKNHLLRRLQRQMDSEEILPKPKVEEELFSKSFEVNKIESCFLERPKRENKRLGLLKRRNEKF